MCLMPKETSFQKSYLITASHAQTLDHVQANTAKPKDHAARSDLNLGGVDHRPDARGHTTANVTDLVKGRVLAHLGQRDLGQNRVVRKG